MNSCMNSCMDSCINSCINSTNQYYYNSVVGVGKEREAHISCSTVVCEKAAHVTYWNYLGGNCSCAGGPSAMNECLLHGGM